MWRVVSKNCFYMAAVGLLLPTTAHSKTIDLTCTNLTGVIASDLSKQILHVDIDHRVFCEKQCSVVWKLAVLNDKRIETGIFGDNRSLADGGETKMFRIDRLSGRFTARVVELGLSVSTVNLSGTCKSMEASTDTMKKMSNAPRQ